MNPNTKIIIIQRISNSFLLPEERKRHLLHSVESWTQEQCERIEKAFQHEPQLLVEIVEHCVERAKEEGNLILLKKIGDIILRVTKDMEKSQERYETDRDKEDLSHFFDAV